MPITMKALPEEIQFGNLDIAPRAGQERVLRPVSPVPLRPQTSGSSLSSSPSYISPGPGYISSYSPGQNIPQAAPQGLQPQNLQTFGQRNINDINAQMNRRGIYGGAGERGVRQQALAQANVCPACGKPV